MENNMKHQKNEITTIQQTIAVFNDAARKLFGADVNILVARAPAFGNDDVCFVVQGRRQTEVAHHLLRFMRGGKISENASEFMGTRTVSTVVEGLASDRKT